MIAHIQKPKERRPTPPLVLARQMVAKTLLSDAPARGQRRKWLRRAVLTGLLAALTAGIAAIYYGCR